MRFLGLKIYISLSEKAKKTRNMRTLMNHSIIPSGGIVYDSQFVQYNVVVVGFFLFCFFQSSVYCSVLNDQLKLA